MKQRSLFECIKRGSNVPLFSWSSLRWVALFLLGFSCRLYAQQDSVANRPKFRANLDIVSMSVVFNQLNMRAVESGNEIVFQPLKGWNQHRVFRRTRLLTLPSKIWVPFKDTTLDGDSGIYKEKVLRIRGRLVTASDSGAWIYQHLKKRVAYVPYTKTALVKSGSSTGRTMYLAVMPVVAEIATWAALDAAEADVYGSGKGLIGASIVFLTGATDFFLWLDYMDKKSHSPLCLMFINGSPSKGRLYKHYAEGGIAQRSKDFVEVMFSEVNFFPRTYVRKTSVDPRYFPASLQLPALSN